MIRNIATLSQSLKKGSLIFALWGLWDFWATDPGLPYPTLPYPTLLGPTLLGYRTLHFWATVWRTVSISPWRHYTLRLSDLDVTPYFFSGLSINYVTNYGELCTGFSAGEFRRRFRCFGRLSSIIFGVHSILSRLLKEIAETGKLLHKIESDKLFHSPPELCKHRVKLVYVTQVSFFTR